MGHVVGMHLVVELPLATLQQGLAEMLFSGSIRFSLCLLVTVCARQLALSHMLKMILTKLRSLGNCKLPFFL